MSCYAIFRSVWIRVACTLFVMMSAVTPALADVSEAINLRIEELLLTDDLEVRGIPVASTDILQAFYADRNFQPAWNDGPKITQFLAAADSAGEDGLDADDYFVDTLRALRERQRSDDAPMLAADLDILLTESLIRYGYHQRFGKVNPARVDTNINFRRELLSGQSPAATVQTLIDAPSAVQQLEEWIPRGPVYLGLKKELAEYRAIAAAGGWPIVPAGPTLHPDDSDERVTDLRKRLIVTGDLPSDADMESPLFDAGLEQAVIAFQNRHELGADGIVGAQTIMAMNVPAETRVDQLRLSLERIRWISEEVTEKFVVVNIAGFRVFLIEDGEISWVARAQVGKTYRQTPVFRGDIRYLEINPTWTVPPTILRNDILPKLKQDPNYLVEKNISVIDRDGKKVDPHSIDWNQYSRGVPYTLRQEPGPGNALGRIKFIFPNEHFVFLHDTPSRSLFERTDRTFSSGCIRVDQPLVLAEKLLDDPEKWNQASLEAVIDGRKTQRIFLEDTVPVVIIYLTAMLEPVSDDVRFMKDVYDRDQPLLDALNGEVLIDLPASAD